MQKGTYAELLCCSQQWLHTKFLPATMCEVDMPDISNYTARQLRKLLLQDFQISRDIVNKILDRKELKDLAESILFASQYSNCSNAWRDFGVTSAIFVVAAMLFFTFHQEIWFVFRFLTGNFVNLSQLDQRYYILRKSLKQYRSLLGATAVILAYILDGLAFYIQASALLSWVVPYHWTIYRYLWFGVPLPVNAGDIMSQYVGAKTGQHDRWKSSAAQDSSNPSRGWTINAGPMLTLSALRYLALQLDHFGMRRFMQVKANGKKNKDEASAGNDGTDFTRQTKVETKDPWAADKHGNTAGRGHGYAANYRNNKPDSVNWLLKPRPKPTENSTEEQPNDSSSNNISAHNEEIFANDSNEENKGSSSSAAAEVPNSRYQEEIRRPHEKKPSSRHPLDEDDGWASDDYY